MFSDIHLVCLENICMHHLIINIKLYYTDMQYRGFDKCIYTVPSHDILQDTSHYSDRLFLLLPLIICAVPLIHIFIDHVFVE